MKTSRHRVTVPAIVPRFQCGKAVGEHPCHTHLKSSTPSYLHPTSENPRLHQTLNRSLSCIITQSLPTIFPSFFSMYFVNQLLSTLPPLHLATRLHQTINRSLFCIIIQSLSIIVSIFFSIYFVNQLLSTLPPLHLVTSWYLSIYPLSLNPRVAGCKFGGVLGHPSLDGSAIRGTLSYMLAFKEILVDSTLLKRYLCRFNPTPFSIFLFAASIPSSYLQTPAADQATFSPGSGV
jgi:hypothetical protein